MKRLLLILIIGIFLISLISASQVSLGTFKKNECIDLVQTCASCSYNNLTSMVYPNGTKHLFIPEQDMTQLGTEYTYETCNFSSQLGIYKVNGHGDLNGVDTIWNYEYEITESGQTITEGKTLGGIGLLFAVFAVALAFMFIGNKLSENDKTLPIGFFFVVMSILLIIYSLHLGWIFSVNFLQDEVLSQGVERIFVAVIWSSAGISIIFISLMLIAFIKELGKMNKTKKFGDDFNPITDIYE